MLRTPGENLEWAESVDQIGRKCLQAQETDPKSGVVTSWSNVRDGGVWSITKCIDTFPNYGPIRIVDILSSDFSVFQVLDHPFPDKLVRVGTKSNHSRSYPGWSIASLCLQKGRERYYASFDEGKLTDLGFYPDINDPNMCAKTPPYFNIKSDVSRFSFDTPSGKWTRMDVTRGGGTCVVDVIKLGKPFDYEGFTFHPSTQFSLEIREKGAKKGVSFASPNNIASRTLIALATTPTPTGWEKALALNTLRLKEVS